MRLLVAEDSIECTELIKLALVPVFGEEIETVDNMDAVLRILSPDFALIWLDLQLVGSPPQRTISCIPAIRARCPDGPLIVVSGYEIYRDDAMHAGADAYAHKEDLQGFRIEAICKIISNAALVALSRGANAKKILDTISGFVSRVSKA